MLSVLTNVTYRRLFTAQVVALVGTGLMTVALALLAYDLAGENAGAVLGTALAIKMVAYVVVGLLAGGVANLVPRRAFLVSLDLVRAAVAVALPFVDQVWQIYVLIALLQSASAAFTPTFQATIPDILTRERDYTNALSLSRIAYDLENLLSPMLAAALVALVGYHWLFAGTVFGFLASAALVLCVVLPAKVSAAATETALGRITRGSRIYLATPRLRGLLALNLAVAAAGAMIIVNTVVLARTTFGLGEADVAIALAVFGGGSMLAALALPRVLDAPGDRSVMTVSAVAVAFLLCGLGAVLWIGEGPHLWSVMLLVWGLGGIFYSAMQVPTGRLLRRSAHEEDRPALFSAQFALSHACWLVTYPLAGWLGATAGMPVTLAALGAVAFTGALAAILLWPSDDRDVVPHQHPELPPNHPHLKDAGRGPVHAHAYVIDDLHRRWPAVSG
ncbi:MFS transporter [Parvibaculum sp.]|uniref:MFS transporter n=1 Tax=Parvibaculum sp. TaxID=2024848 RepID=UPI001B1327A2|nr:MFS transporter [Parvibaculum sp.]MBO6667138.1 MFS transporter [Parvibaculum sp.]MBO6693062.1 MFS transporter [Parvibaculum sp.]MBO6713691.1 MFS transporter [Parvibaculum sp.]